MPASSLKQYESLTGYMKVMPTKRGEAPIWCPVRILEATTGYQKLFFLIEPLGGYGTMRLISTRVWLDNPELNQCRQKPT